MHTTGWWRWAWLAGSLLAISASGCGGSSVSTGGLSASDRALAVKIEPKAAQMSLLSDATSATESHCVAERLVARLGATRIAQLDDSSEFVLDPTDAANSVDDYLGCVDVRKKFMAGLTTKGVSAKSATCTADKMGAPLFRELALVGLQFQKNSKLPDGMAKRIVLAERACLTADEQKKSSGR